MSEPIILASFTELDNANALSNHLRNHVRHLWVLVYSKTNTKPYRVAVQHASDSPCSKNQLDECAVAMESFDAPLEEPEPEVINDEQVETVNASSGGVITV